MDLILGGGAFMLLRECPKSSRSWLTQAKDDMVNSAA